ncbi:MAG TPA: hypothetical protein VMV49_17215 [Candidatus Deferrimicrobium sp.]|nr:hypothetical protein [Candidatus Deferrimicrobium sp.]
MEKADQINDDGSKKISKLTEIMSNYITLLSPPEQLQKQLQEFFMQRTNYEDQITSQNHSIEALQKEIKQRPKLELTIQELKNQILELQHKSQGLEDTLNSLSESQSVKTLNVTLQSAIKAKDAKISELSTELQSLKLNNEQIAKDLSAIPEFKLEIARLNNKLVGENKTNQELRQTLQKEREGIKTLLSEKNGLEYALRRLERRLTAKGALRGLSIPVHHLEISEDLTGKADADIQEQIQTMKLELQKRLDMIKELEIRNNGLKQQLAQSSTRDLQIEVGRLKSELEGRKGSIMGLESTRKKLMEQTEAFQQRIADLQNKIMSQGKEIEEKNNTIQNLETAVSSGVHDAHARDVIQNLQEQNREYRNEVRESEKIIRSLEKNIKFLQTEIKNQKDQSYKLYNQTKDQLVLIHKLETALEQGGTSVDIDLKSLKAATRSSSLLDQEGPSLDDEIKERDRKINRLESYINSLKQETEDLNFRINSRDVKIDELTRIINEIKTDLANTKTKILIRPPSADEYQKTKIKL